MNLNLRTMTATRAVAIAYEGQGDEQYGEDVLRLQTQWACSSLDRVQVIEDVPLIENARTLAHPGMHVSDLFTERNWSLICYARELINRITPPQVRDAALLWLTASVAQCSRLIAHRANLTGGGPAWTVPGFWVPPIHLETNPAVHLKARAKKFERGLGELVGTPAIGGSTTRLADAVTGLHEVHELHGRAHLVFLDPPYGDSVPYLEFSALWNAVLGTRTAPAADMSISDRRDSPSGWDAYATKLKDIAAAASDLIGAQGCVLITFNNNDVRAWAALLSALQAANLSCESVWYQIPAVVPSKAQFSPRGSYISDVYAVFRHGAASDVGTTSDVVQALSGCAAARSGRVPVSVARRTLVIAWMEHNLPADGLHGADSLLGELFDEDGDALRWKGELAESDISLDRIVADVVDRHVTPGGYPWVKLYEEIAAAMASSGVPDPWEIRQAWGDVRLQARLCVRDRAADDQLPLFSGP
jgi:hypothetical protein